MGRVWCVVWAMSAAALFNQGCATRGFVRARLEDLRRSIAQDTDRLQRDLVEARKTSQEAMARADLAFGEAGEARDLALGKAGFQEAAHYSVFFAFNSSELDETAAQVLDEMVPRVQAHPEYLVDIIGFTDRTGSAGYNLVLGQRRAEAVLRYLSVRTPGMLSRYAAASYGAEASVGDQSTEDGRARNRRVVVSLITRTRLPEEISRSGSFPLDDRLASVSVGP